MFPRARFSVPLVACGFLLQAASLTAEPARHPTGYRQPDPKEWSEQVARSKPAVARRLAGRVVPSAATIDFQWLPAIGYQSYGNCGAWPSAYYQKTYYEAREHGWVRPSPAVDPEHVTSVAFAYSLEYNPGYEGSSPSYIAEVMKRYGTTTWVERPESSGYTNPTEAEWRLAARYRAADWQAIDFSTPAGRATAKAFIAGGDPISSGWGNTTTNVHAYHGGTGTGVDNDVLYAFVGGSGPGHAVTIVGYDDNKPYQVAGENRSGAWLVANQWGTNWGVTAEPGGTAGYMWIAYDLMGSGIVLEDRIGYEPKDFFVYTIHADIPGYVDVDLVYGDPLVPTATLPLFYVQCLNSFETTVAEDITDYRSVLHDKWNWRLELYHVAATNAGASRWKPWIENARLELENQDPITFAGLPLTGGNSLETVHVDQACNARTTDLFKDLDTNTHGQAFWIDWNSDGHDDLYVGGQANMDLWAQGITEIHPNRIFLYGEDGSYTSTSIGVDQFNWSTQLQDFNRDGLPDLLTASDDGVDREVDLYLQGANGGMARVRGIVEPPGGAVMGSADVNNDGAPDLLISGQFATGVGLFTDETRLYLNDGAGGFDELLMSLPVRAFHDWKWADFDQDGWIDLVFDDSVYRNMDGAGFEARATLPISTWALAIDDMDRDGRPDIAALGSMETRVLHNAGDFTFETAQTLPGFVYLEQRPNAAFWGDYDADGRLDFLQSGFLSMGNFVRAPREVQFHRQLANGTFDRPGLIFPPLSSGIVTGADIDADGDLDLYVSGQQTTPFPDPAPAMIPWDSGVYRNVLKEFAGVGANTPPEAPTGLQSQVLDAATGAVNLTWTAPGDAQELTPLALGYRLRVGTTPGGSQVVSNAGPRERRGLWIAPGTPGKRLRDLAVGRYYWSVQAVDSSHAAGPWSPEASFTLGAPGNRGDVNHDGIVDAADEIATSRMLAKVIAEDLGAADADESGRLDADDSGAVAARLVGAAWLKGEIGTTGGAIRGNGFNLQVPAGAFLESVALTVKRSDADPMDVGGSTHGYAIEGLPVDYLLPITLELYNNTGGDNERFLLGEHVLRRSDGALTTAWRPLPTTPLGSGWYRTLLPVPQNGTRRAGRASGIDGGTFELQLQEITVDQDPLWRITLPPSQLAMLPRIKAALNGAYTKFSTAPFNFSYADRTNWPMDVFFRPMDPDDDGGQVASKWGVNYSYIELNTKFLTAPDGFGDDPSLEILIGHEFFHFVQSLYDPRTGFSQATTTGYGYWVDEMTATWVETLFSPDPNYVPSVARLYKDAPLSGLPRADFSFYNTPTSHLRRWGYGLAPLCDFLAQHYGPQFIPATYQKIKAGTMPISALSTSLYTGAPDTQLWWSSFAEEWVDDERLFFYNGHLLKPIKDSDFPGFAIDDRRISLESGKLSNHLFLPLSPYQIGGVTITPMNAALTALSDPATKIMFRLKDSSQAAGMHIAALDNQDPTIHYQATRLSANVLRADVPGTLQLAQRNSYLAAVITSTENKIINPQLDVYVLYNNTQTLAAANVGQAQVDGSKFPTYHVTATLGVKDTGGIEDYSLPAGYQSALLGIVWTTKKETFPFDVQIALTSGNTKSMEWAGYRYDSTLTNTKYRLVRRNREYTTIYRDEVVSSLNLNLDVDPAMNYQFYDVVIVATIEEKTYAPNTVPDPPWVLLSTQTLDWEIPATSAFLLIGDRNWEETEEVPFDPTARGARAVPPRAAILFRDRLPLSASR